jgi:hypothetical protein
MKATLQNEGITIVGGGRIRRSKGRIRIYKSENNLHMQNKVSWLG